MLRADIVKKFWNTMHQQQWEHLHNYFNSKATIEWPNTNEIFTTVDSFVRANSEYPGDWSIRIDRIEEFGNLVVSVVCVSLNESKISFYATSFFEFNNQTIMKLTEYWGDVGSAPEWRKKLGVSELLNK